DAGGDRGRQPGLPFARPPGGGGRRQRGLLLHGLLHRRLPRSGSRGGAKVEKARRVEGACRDRRLGEAGVLNRETEGMDRGGPDRGAGGVPAGGWTYRRSGVDIDAGNEAVRRYKPHVASTRRPGVLGQIGGFGGLFDLSQLDGQEGGGG